MAATNSIDALFAPPPSPRGGDQALGASGGERFEPSLARALQAKPADRRPLSTDKPEANAENEAPTADRVEPRISQRAGAASEQSADDCQDCEAAGDNSEAAAGEDAVADESEDDNQDALTIIDQADSTQDAVPVADVLQPIPPAALDEVLSAGAADDSALPVAATTDASLSNELPSDAEPPNSTTSNSQQASMADPVADGLAIALPNSADEAGVDLGSRTVWPAGESTAVADDQSAVVVEEAADPASSLRSTEPADAAGPETIPSTGALNDGVSTDVERTPTANAEGEADQELASQTPVPLRGVAKSDSASTKPTAPAAARSTPESVDRVRRGERTSSADQPNPESAPTAPAAAEPSIETPVAESNQAPTVGNVAAAAGTTRGATTIERLGNAQFSAESTQRSEQDGAPVVDRNRFLQRVEGAFKAARERDGRIQVRLSPPELGALRIEMVMQNGALTARIEAETQAARTTLLDNLPALRERLAQQEIRIEKFDVDVRRDGGGAGGSTGGQSREEQADQSSWRDNGGRPRNQPQRQQSTATPRSTPAARPTYPDTALDVRI